MKYDGPEIISKINKRNKRKQNERKTCTSNLIRIIATPPPDFFHGNLVFISESVFSHFKQTDNIVVFLRTYVGLNWAYVERLVRSTNMYCFMIVYCYFLFPFCLGNKFHHRKKSRGIRMSSKNLFRIEHK